MNQFYIQLKQVQNIIIGIICISFGFCDPLFAQKPDGIPFIKNYSPNEYKQATDNWAIAQDKRGVMYFGNAGGILEYDGNKWELIPVSNSSLVRSIAINDEGIIYIGAVGDFGYLSPNQKGKMEYHSLANQLPDNERDFADVWKTHITKDGVYFQTFSKLIRVKNNTIDKIWKPTTSFHFSFYTDGDLFINEREQGLKQLVNDSLILVKGGELFKNLRIYSVLPYSHKQLLIATREKGLLFLDRKADEDHLFRPWNAEANKELIAAQIYGATALNNNCFAFATLQSGVIIINNQGKIIQTLNKQNGLRDDIVNYVNTDQQNDLWIALGNGIAHVEISSPLTTLADAQGLAGSVQDIIKFKGALYVATSLGVFGAVNDYFVQVKGIHSQAWALEKFVTEKDTFLLASTEEGIARIDKFNAAIIQEGFSYNLCQSNEDPKRLYIANSDGLSSMKYETGKWIYEDYLSGIDNEIRSIVEDKKQLWLGTPFDGLIKIDFNHTKNSKDSLITAWDISYKIHHYDTTNGLPDLKYNIPCRFNNKIVFATSEGVYEFNKATSRFRLSSFLNKELKETQVYRFVPKENGSIYLVMVKPNQLKEFGIASLQPDKSYSLYSQPFLKLFEREIHAVFPDENSIAWLGGPDGIVRYDGKRKKNFDQPFFALIRKVSIGKDSLIFGGSFYRTEQQEYRLTYLQDESSRPEVSYRLNSFVFEYSATSFGMENETMYNFFMEGRDTEWSGWLNKTSKEYTDLSEGDYVFHVKAKNIYGVESVESVFAFTVLPPWYRTIWAYIAYVLIVIGSIYAIIRLSIRRLVKAKNQLEKVVKERTAEVVAQKHLIEEKHKEITDSINYAERIQRSFLATKDMLDENLKDYFVFFKPKDVVSGDFYWASFARASETNGDKDLFYLATADSTGHGVPGAIMSLLNITSLEKAIEQCHAPADMLNFTRNHIIERLKKDGSPDGGKDGMDCSLCAYDFRNMKLYITAANNPVWIVRKSMESQEPTVIEVKPDKMPVGKHDRQDVPFSQHEIDLQPGDVIYTLTDGFPDQFGGEKGKKFMSKNLRELLAANSDLPMQSQKQLLQTTFDNWVGTLEQIDDVTIIGVRIH